MHLGKVLGVCLITQSRPIPCNCVDCCLPGSSVYELPRARILEKYWQYWQHWRSVAISFSRWSYWHRDRTSVSCVSCIIRQILYPLSHWGSLERSFRYHASYPFGLLLTKLQLWWTTDTHPHRFPSQDPTESLGYSSRGLSLIHGNVLYASIRYPREMRMITSPVMGNVVSAQKFICWSPYPQYCTM